MPVSIDISILFSYLRSTSNLALSCREFNWKTKSNGFPIRTNKAGLCLENWQFYKSLDYPGIDEWMTRQVFGAIRANNSKRLQLLLDHGANIETENDSKSTPLVRAAWNGKVDCLKLLLENKANIEAENMYGYTAIRLAAGNGNINCLKVLLEHKANIETKDNDGFTPLMRAVSNNYPDCLKVLLEAKADPETKDNSGHTALEWAAEYHKVECLGLLLEHGAVVEPRVRESYRRYSYLWGDSSL